MDVHRLAQRFSERCPASPVYGLLRRIDARIAGSAAASARRERSGSAERAHTDPSILLLPSPRGTGIPRGGAHPTSPPCTGPGAGASTPMLVFFAPAITAVRPSPCTGRDHLIALHHVWFARSCAARASILIPPKIGSSSILLQASQVNGAQAMFDRRSAAFPKPAERVPVSGWTSGVECRVGRMVRTQ